MKNNGKSYVYTLILGLCMIVSLALIARMMLYKPAKIHTPMIREPNPITLNEIADETRKTKEIKLTNDDVSALINEKMPTGFPLKNIQTEISAASTIKLSGPINKKDRKSVV